ncbi:hypothetical protein HPDFL43_00016070 [Hoeflea phototrophica DFL-43]|uniref:Uncharacterized protein n=1 Tax=Hoeflea phototrophica (strain DSM 17068 / NCIMB 14078 / DFL-43) TaxID=411684 RepID=A0A094ZYT7_HOEPD|nr:hypothetical protein HPDFL43_00016070 [Hoeflea phototrophica DFL-43]
MGLWSGWGRVDRLCRDQPDKKIMIVPSRCDRCLMVPRFREVLRRAVLAELKPLRRFARLKLPVACSVVRTG